MTDWLTIQRGNAPLLLTVPHAGTDLAGLEDDFVSPELARQDADWFVDELYAFARDMSATVIATAISRSVIDVNRDPSGASLYPGQATTGLCPVTTFDGAPLHSGDEPDEAEVERRKALWFAPYHAAIEAEIARLKAAHGRVVVYDAHSIRSRVPRLFDGELPQFNIGTDGGRTCGAALQQAILSLCEASGHSTVLNGRFKGGWSTRHHGRPAEGVHAIQMELAMRGYVGDDTGAGSDNWPPALLADPPIRPTLEKIIAACIEFGSEKQ